MTLVAVFDEDHVLVGQIDRNRFRRYVDANRIAQNFSCEGGYFVRHRRGEQQRLARFRQRRHDAPHVANEAHVQQSVRFVEHEQRHFVESREPLSDEVEQAPRCGHEYVDTATQCSGLRILSDTAEDAWRRAD